jgi:head-tail adaptor
MIRRGLDRSPVSAGQRIHRVTVQTPTAPTPDGDGNYTQDYADATPASWMVELRAASLRDLERYAAGTTVTTAAYLVSGPYRPDVTTAARLVHRGRALQLARVTNVDERGRELVCIAVELVTPAPAPIAQMPAAAPASTPLGGWSND